MGWQEVSPHEWLGTYHVTRYTALNKGKGRDGLSQGQSREVLWSPWTQIADAMALVEAMQRAWERKEKRQSNLTTRLEMIDCAPGWRVDKVQDIFDAGMSVVPIGSHCLRSAHGDTLAQAITRLFAMDRGLMECSGAGQGG